LHQSINQSKKSEDANTSKSTTKLLATTLSKLKSRRSNLKTINLSKGQTTKQIFNIKSWLKSVNSSSKHFGLATLAIIVILSNLQMPIPSGIGGNLDSGGMRYKTIAEIASTATLTDLGNPFYNNEEHTINIDNDGEYMLKTVQTETIISRSTRNEVIKYIIKPGESLSSLASDFGLTTLTVKHANNLSSNTLKVGQELKIPPIDGLFVTVKRNDTISSIANNYRVKVDDVLKYNNLTRDDSIFAGNELLIPGAIVSASSSPVYNKSGNISVPNFNPSPYSGKFIWPTSVPTHYLSQGYRWGHRAIDLPRTNGWGIYASAPGIVQTKSTRWGYGNLIIINHGDGWSTYYAHLSEYKVTPGQYVEQGQLIGIMGNTGRSTGPHLHFEIRQNGTPLNPLSYLPQ